MVKKMDRTKRVKIVTGLKCNIQCIFCYYRDSLKLPNKSFEAIKKDLLYAKTHGIKEVDFSGGEPTIHPDLPKLISEAKNIGMEKVCIISNGWRLSDITYMKLLKDAGLDEILFSLHGSTENIHDNLTNTKGSFERICKALSNAASEGIKIRTNTVVNRINFETLTGIAEFIKQFNPIQVNFITINDWCFAKHLIDKLMVRYNEMASHLKNACDIIRQQVEAVNVRYIPFCFMQGYEQFVCNHKQVPYDKFEWAQRVRARLEAQNNIWRYTAILGYGFIMGGAFRGIRRKPISDILDDSVTEALRRWNYRKGPDCLKCSLNSICDGLEKTYAEKFGLEELSPIAGEKILDATLFRRNEQRKI